MNAIRVKEALEILDASIAENRHKPFKLIFCTGDASRGTGGERIVFDRAVLASKRQKSAIVGTGGRASSREKRYPVLITNLSSMETRRVNVQLIEEINGQIVL